MTAINICMQSVILVSVINTLFVGIVWGLAEVYFGDKLGYKISLYIAANAFVIFMLSFLIYVTNGVCKIG